MIGHEQLCSILKNEPVFRSLRRYLGNVECWVVGGWIRDRVLGRNPADLDLVIGDGCEESVARLAVAMGLKAHNLGPEGKRCWMIAAPSGRSIPLGGKERIQKIEIWPLGALTVEDDALRRDFSVNALYWRFPDGPLVDPADGLDDLFRKRLRAVKRTNLENDPIRLLRAARLTASLGFSVDSTSRMWIRRTAPRLGHASKERIGAEIRKLCASADPARGLSLAEDLGILLPAGPGDPGEQAGDPRELVPLGQGRPVRRAIEKPEVFLAYVFRRWNVASARELAGYAFPRQQVKKALAAVRDMEDLRRVSVLDWKIRRLEIARMGVFFPVALALAGAVDLAEGNEADPWRRWWRQWENSAEELVDVRLPLDVPAIVAATGIPPGPELGKLVDSLKQAVVTRDVRSPTGALDLLRRLRQSAP